MVRVRRLQSIRDGYPWQDLRRIKSVATVIVHEECVQKSRERPKADSGSVQNRRNKLGMLSPLALLRLAELTKLHLPELRRVCLEGAEVGPEVLGVSFFRLTVFISMISRGDIQRETRSENVGKALIWQGKFRDACVYPVGGGGVFSGEWSGLISRRRRGEGNRVGSGTEQGWVRDHTLLVAAEAVRRGRRVTKGIHGTRIGFVIVTMGIRMASATPQMPSATPQMPSATPQMPSATPQMASAMPQTSSATPQMASATPQMASATPQMASATPQTSSATPQMPSATPQMPSASRSPGPEGIAFVVRGKRGGFPSPAVSAAPRSVRCRT